MELAAAIYRIVRESLTNVCRHSKSQKARIEVREGDGQVHIDIKDWGIGFDDREVGPGKFGLLGVRQRAIAARRGSQGDERMRPWDACLRLYSGRTDMPG